MCRYLVAIVPRYIQYYSQLLRYYYALLQLQNVHLRKHALIHHDLIQSTTMDRIGKAAFYVQF